MGKTIKKIAAVVPRNNVLNLVYVAKSTSIDAAAKRYPPHLKEVVTATEKGPPPARPRVDVGM